MTGAGGAHFSFLSSFTRLSVTTTLRFSVFINTGRMASFPSLIDRLRLRILVEFVFPSREPWSPWAIVNVPSLKVNLISLTPGSTGLSPPSSCQVPRRLRLWVLVLCRLPKRTGSAGFHSRIIGGEFAGVRS